jgi:hypothetical protein
MNVTDALNSRYGLSRFIDFIVFLILVAVIFYGLYILFKFFYKIMGEKTNITEQLIVGVVLAIIGFLGFNKGRNYDYGYGPQGFFILLMLIAVALFGIYVMIGSFHKLVKMWIRNPSQKS